MKELIERLRGRDRMGYGRLKERTEAANAPEQQAKQIEERDVRIFGLEAAVSQLNKQIEELAAALAVKDEALKYAATAFRELAQQCDGDYETADQMDASIALQPHASLVAKIKADAVREFHAFVQSLDGVPINAIEYANSIEREVK